MKNRDWSGKEFNLTVHRSGDLADLSLVPGFRVHAGIGTANEPEDGWRTPLSAKGSEILAGSRGLSFLHAVSGEVLPKSITYSSDCIRVVPDKRVTVHRSDFRLLRRPGSFGFCIDDAFDRRKDPVPDSFIKGANVQLDNCFVWDDIFFRAGLKRADGDDGGFCRGNLAGNDRLQAEYGGNCLWHRSVSASSKHSNL